MCRYPLSAKQVERVDAYAQAIDEDGPGLSMARTIIAEGAEKALADFARFYPEAKRAWSEQSMLSGYEQLEEPDPQLALRMLALHDLPEGTWGYEFVEFYRRNGLELPGVNPKTPAFFFAHDMNHVIAGYEPVGIEEVALSAMILASDDSDENWMLMVTSLAAYQVGVLNSPEFEAKEAIFEREGAVEIFAEAFRRGANCSAPFSNVDHWALVDRPLDELRASFGIEDRRI
jgi:ubiquinone biosynthesis protein Coq4